MKFQWIGEVVNLDKHSINMAEQSVIGFGKGKKEREVYFNTRCSIWLMGLEKSETTRVFRTWVDILDVSYIRNFFRYC